MKLKLQDGAPLSAAFQNDGVPTPLPTPSEQTLTRRHAPAFTREDGPLQGTRAAVHDSSVNERRGPVPKRDLPAVHWPSVGMLRLPAIVREEPLLQDNITPAKTYSPERNNEVDERGMLNEFKKWDGPEINPKDELARIGNRYVDEKTAQRLANITNVRKRLHDLKAIDHFADLIGLAVESQGLGGIDSRRLAYSIRMLLHLGHVGVEGVPDQKIRKIAMMGMQLARKYWRTGGIPPGGFKTLYDNLGRFGYNYRGVLRNPGKRIQRGKFTQERMATISEFKQFIKEIEPQLGEVPEELKELFAKAPENKASEVDKEIAILYSSASVAAYLKTVWQYFAHPKADEDAA